MGAAKNRVVSTRELPIHDPFGRDVTLPDGRNAADINPSEIARVLIAAGVPGITHAMGKVAILDAYRSYLATLVQEAGDKAVDAWMEAHR